MSNIGRTFVLDYGDFAVRVRYISDQTLEWQQLKGPEEGSKGQQPYQQVELRPNVHLVWWQEPDRSVVTQVVDFERQVVYTTWVGADLTIGHFKGSIRSESE